MPAVRTGRSNTFNEHPPEDRADRVAVRLVRFSPPAPGVPALPPTRLLLSGSVRTALRPVFRGSPRSGAAPIFFSFRFDCELHSSAAWSLGATQPPSEERTVRRRLHSSAARSPRCDHVPPRDTRIRHAHGVRPPTDERFPNIRERCSHVQSATMVAACSTALRCFSATPPASTARDSRRSSRARRPRRRFPREPPRAESPGRDALRAPRSRRPAR